jgi:hypothetical protein
MDRRKYLKLLAGAGGLTGLAGCSALGTDDEKSPATDTGDTTTPTETPANSTPTPDETASPEPDESPVITTATTSVEENGGTLGYGGGAEDDYNLSEGTVEYGGQQVDQWTEDLEDEFQTTGRIDTEQIDPEEGYIKFTATDSAGQTTEEIRNPDEQAPTITELNATPTTQQGEISLEALVEDNKGLDQLNLYLDGETILQQDISGNLETSLDTTIDITELATLGEENTLTAELIDSFVFS